MEWSVVDDEYRIYIKSLQEGIINNAVNMLRHLPNAGKGKNLYNLSVNVFGQEFKDMRFRIDSFSLTNKLPAL